MNTEFLALCEELTKDIQSSYQSGITLEEAEKLAGKFLHALLTVSSELQAADLDSRMRKNGAKAIKAAIYLDEATKGDKKPSDVYLAAKVDSNELVIGEQTAFDTAEVTRDALQNYYNIFREAHLHFRTIARGRFE